MASGKHHQKDQELNYDFFLHRNVAASVAQLVALTKTKKLPTKFEDNQQQVIRHGDIIITTSHDVLSSARESQDLEMASVLMEDLGELSENQAKRLTMATQVQVLKLEKELQNEQEKLRRLRRLNYMEESST
eukprot:m.112616 g.112616  ORF g.112616 m.112616 type:complete len:132 (-) comp22834_c0_seq3:259-654(-)